MVLMSGGFVINDVVWEFHETTLDRSRKDVDILSSFAYNNIIEQQCSLEKCPATLSADHL